MTRAALVLSLFCLAGPVSAVELRTFQDARVVKPAALPAALCRGWVEALAGDAVETLPLYDLHLALAPQSRVLLGCSSSYLYALVLAGRLEQGGAAAEPGQILIWEHFASRGAAPLVRIFSAQRLEEAFTKNGRAGDAALTALAAREKKLRWWGRLTATSFNVASPAPGPVEELRRSYQIQPEVIALKRAGRTHEEYARLTAAAFATALKGRQPAQAAALLAPTVTGQHTAAQFDVLLRKQRTSRAAALLAQRDWSALDPERTAHAGGPVFTVPLGARTLHLTLAPFDDNLFISGAEVK